jgi:membrane protein
MSDPGSEGSGGARARLIAIVDAVDVRAREIPLVRALIGVLGVYDAAGGGLLAGGLAYTSLLALLPSMLLVVSVVGLVVDDPARRAEVVAAIAMAAPPLEEIVRLAFEQVAAGAVPSGIVAVIGLLWGSSRFYSSLDNAFARVFHGERRRNEIERTIRGLAVTALFVALPITALVIGSVGSWLLDLAPRGTVLDGAAATAWQVLQPLGSLALFVVVAAAVYRFVPPVPVSMRALSIPSIAAGLVLAGFTQVFTYAAPRLVGVAAFYGPFVAAFAVLAWFAIGFNVLLVGASWTRVRVLGEHSRTDEDAPADRA